MASRAEANARFQKQLAENATRNRPPLSWRGEIVERADTSGAEGIDLKLFGSMPITDAARLFALATGVHATGTLDRLSDGGARKGIARTDLTDWRDAFAYLQMAALAHAASTQRREPALRSEPTRTARPSRKPRKPRPPRAQGSAAAGSQAAAAPVARLPVRERLIERLRRTLAQRRPIRCARRRARHGNFRPRSAARPAPGRRVVDGLLASPRYGERWGRIWLDVVRYADTGGFETDLYYQNAWRYRDYVIQSFNSDKPYNQFVKEQIAADELWPDNLDLEGSYKVPKAKLDHLNARLGTGLYTFGPVMHESGLDGEFLRSEWLADAADITGAAFLGLTYGCARCHDHKFDPITARDYYRMQAVFAGSEQKEISMVPIMSVFDYWQGLPKVRAVNDLANAVRRISDQAKQRIVARMKLKYSPGVVEAFDTPEETRTAKQKELAIDLEAAFRNISEKDLDQEYTPEERQQRRELIEKIGYAYLKAPTRYPTATVLGHAEIVPETHILERGDHKKKGALVTPGLPGFLVDKPDIQEPADHPLVPQRRRALALWLADPGNPLTARVIVNRIWQGHFVRGIVGTPNDFGRQGDRPTHPELLDWLAVEFVEKGWSIKAMHRLIMLSNTYQMSSAWNEANAKLDGDNRFLWRMNRRRLEAEMVRDSVLSVAGSMSFKMGGPPVIPPLTREEMAGLKDASQWPVDLDKAEHMRRSVYLYVKRSFRMPLFEAFDMPDTSISCERRNVTTVAPQALALMNNEFMMEQAQAFAERLMRDHGEDPGKWIDAAWRSAMSRPPSDAEKRDALRFLQQHNDDTRARLARLCLAVFNMNEFLYVD